MGADSFAKLWSSILDSSVWRQPADTKVVWITMLAMAEPDGYVGASVDGLAARAGVTIEATEVALAAFLAPDPRSRSKEHGGRRIAEADRGWMILNYAKFREQRDMLKKRESDRERQRRKRERDAMSRDVTLGHIGSQQVAQGEGEGERDGEGESMDACMLEVDSLTRKLAQEKRP